MSAISTSDRLAMLFASLRYLGTKSGVTEMNLGTTELVQEDSTIVDRLAELLADEQRDSVVFQSIIIACLQTVKRVRQRELLVAEASISLAQNMKLQRLLSELTTVQGLLEGALSDQGRRMLDMSAKKPVQTDDDESRWWYALSEAIHELEEGTERMTSLVSNQERGTRLRLLVGTIVRLLHKHHAALVVEAEEWMQ